MPSSPRFYSGQNILHQRLVRSTDFLRVAFLQSLVHTLVHMKRPAIRLVKLVKRREDSTHVKRLARRSYLAEPRESLPALLVMR